MILIPINAILSDKANNLIISTNVIEEFVGVSFKTLKNIMNFKHKTRQKTKDTIASNLSKNINQVPGMSFDQDKFLEYVGNGVCVMDFEPSEIRNIIQDEYTDYTQKVSSEIIYKDIEIDTFIKNKIAPIGLEEVISFKPLVDYIYNCGLPDYMLNTINIELYDNKMSAKTFFRTIILLLFDVIFYISSAHEVEYNKFFLKCDESRMTKFLPVLKKNELVNPIVRWFDFIMHNCKIKSINEFALMFPKISESNSENDINDGSKLRQIRKWRKGHMLPKWKHIDKMVEKVSREKMSLTVYEEIEEAKERGRYVYGYIKIFQKFLNLLKSEINNPALNLNNQKIEFFFKRYGYWYTYHYNRFSKF
ncbi:hypothetical protein MHK_004037 [Candidatus Magnetomorum sp. HK-1]|nr:hypothetical protein MHK_004037 [Candidatus Magnetomorum sp. HK-1]